MDRGRRKAPPCCRCNGGGKCSNCVCVKAKRQCTNCLPSKRGSCLNPSQLSASRFLDPSTDLPSPHSSSAPPRPSLHDTPVPPAVMPALGPHLRCRHLARTALPRPPSRLQIMPTIFPLRCQWPIHHSYGATGMQRPSCILSLLLTQKLFTGRIISSQFPMEMQGKNLSLGAALGSQEFVETYVSDKVQELNNQLLLLADIARTEPQAAYAAFIHSFAHKFSYLCRTIPNIGSQLQLLEDSIRLRLIPALTGRAPPSDIDRELLALPVRLGGLGLVNPTRQSQQEYQASIEISAPLKNLILEQKSDYCFECLEEQLKARRDTHKRNRDQAKSSATLLRASAPKSLQRAMDLAQEKGASSWLTALPLEEFGLALHKGAFRDAISLRYGWQPLHTPSTCPCGTNFTVEHALSCPKGGFPTLRHNEVRDLTANLMTEVCNDVCIEPTLQPVTGEALSGASALTADGARLDVAASGFWGGRHERAFFDVRVFNPYAPSNRQPLPTCYRRHENIKKRAYEQRVREIEHGSFTPLVMSLTGGLGRAANVCYKRLASLIATKQEQPYSSTIAWIRCRLSFSLLRSSIQCIRGARSAIGRAARQQIPPTDLVSAEAGISHYL